MVGSKQTRAFRLQPFALALVFSLFAAGAQAVAPRAMAGNGLTVALKSDGTVWTCGANSAGQLGIGTVDLDAHPTPAMLAGITGVTAIGLGEIHALALKKDGSVWAMGAAGYNNFGQIGIGDTSGSAAPVQVYGIYQVAAIAAGGLHSVALRSDGTVWTWGYNASGQLGNGSTVNALTPVKVVGLDGVTAIDAGPGNTVALKSNGTVWIWGNNSDGQLGTGSSQAFALTPVQVQSLTGIVAISENVSGNNVHTLALKSDGTIWAWGNNAYAQLGDGSFVDSFVPVQVKGITGVTAIAAGSYFSLALRNDGTVWTWGLNASGRLANGASNFDSYPAPAMIPGLGGVISISAGGGSGLALKGDGSVWTWGINTYGQLCDSSAVQQATSPVQSLLSLGSIFDRQGEYVIEFYNTTLDHFFITSDPQEAQAIDGGSAGPGWSRTGQAFKAGGDTPVCRFYGSVSPGPNSHFFTASDSECKGLMSLQASTPTTDKAWNFERLDFAIGQVAAGACLLGTAPVFRAYNNGALRGVDSNHRISSSIAAIHQVVARGWINEGVVMCAPL
jgi:alpha-tubulin suppressor-like RCC1 family protein